MDKKIIDKKKAKGFLAEFKEFISRGSVMDLAVGMIIGAAFTSIVKALVDNILNPIIGLFVGGIQFSDWKIPLGGESTIDIGAFINAVISFFITAFVIFLIIKLLNGFHRKNDTQPTKSPRLCPYCKSEIADDATRCPYCTSVLTDQPAQ